MITEPHQDKPESRINRAARFISLLSRKKEGRLQPVALRRFSTVLMLTIISLVTVSVVVVLYFVNRYFDERVEEEFRNKLHAEKGQIEILIKNRLDDVNKLLDDLRNDNTIRVTMMWVAQSTMTWEDAQPKLIESISQNYPPDNGVYLFIKKGNIESITPQSYKKLSKETALHAINAMPRGNVLLDKNNPRLVWLFSQPIVGTEGDMGVAAIFYDMREDTRLHESIKSTTKGDLKFLYGGQLIPLGKNLPGASDTEILDDTGDNGQDFRLAGDLVYSQIMTNKNIYYVSTARDLLSERRKVTLLMWIFSAFVLAASVLISVFLARKMVRPLKEMTLKAIRISESNDIPLNFERNNEYWEFDQLSEAFNTMLTHLKEAEERSRYQELLENVDDAVYIMDEQGFIIEANSAAYEPLEYSREQFFNLQLSTIVPLDDYKSIISLGGEPENHSELNKLTIETVHFGKQGQSIPVEIQSRSITYMGKSVILNVARDITERIEAEKNKKNLESQLNQAQKMEAMGTMAGCIAHDFNNLLMAIQGNVDILLIDLDREQKSYTCLEAIEKTLDSATSLTRQLLGFARKEKSEFMPLDVNTLVEESTEMFIKSRKEIKLGLEFDNDMHPVSADRGQLEQVLVNLYINAWQAMPKGGKLNIYTKNVQLDDTFCKPYGLSCGDYVHISVCDTGHGMSREIMAKIFDPFFTTKKAGKGTGLGLASTYGIIRNHKGIIKVESKVGEGTKFNIYLPSINPGNKG